MDESEKTVTNPEPRVVYVRRGIGVLRWIAIAGVAYVVANHVVNKNQENEKE